MMKQKEFDCVQMKNEVQTRIRERFAGMTAEEERAETVRELETSDDILSQKWRRIMARQKNPAACHSDKQKMVGCAHPPRLGAKRQIPLTYENH